MGHLQPQTPRRQAHHVHLPVVSGDVVQTADAAVRAEQLFKLFIAEHHHGVSLDHQLFPTVAHAPFP